MFINLSNHPQTSWCEEQKNAASKYGEIVDLPFPAIDPHWNSEQINEQVDLYEKKILGMPDPTVMLQGEFIFTYRLTCRLKARGIKVVAGCSERRVVEETGEHGELVSRHQFAFVKFAEY